MKSNLMDGWIEPIKFGINNRWYLGHTFRYLLTCGWLKPRDIVVDVSSGCGYGSFIMASFCEKVIGLEIDKGALKRARAGYVAPNIEYRLCDLARVAELPKCDVAVSFETIEHIQRPPKEFAALLKRAAKRLIFFSCPVVPTAGRNPRHVHDFTERQVLRLFLDKKWRLWEKVRQGPYLILIAYQNGGSAIE